MLLLLIGVTATATKAADRAAEIARIHVEAIGGRARIDALQAMLMHGVVVAGSAEIPVTLVAARPARLRVESRFGDRTMVQGSDGVAPPWQLETKSGTSSVAQLSPGAAERFLADAEFDDPLVRWEERGYRVEFAGEVEIAGRKLLRLLVARKVSENLFVLLDPQTCFIVLRVQPVNRGERRVEVVTRYDDYRPVAGVLVPHRLTLFEDGVVSQEARFDHIAPNPALGPGVFSKPVRASGG